jgi:hypothetical protein
VSEGLKGVNKQTIETVGSEVAKHTPALSSVYVHYPTVLPHPKLKMSERTNKTKNQQLNSSSLEVSIGFRMLVARFPGWENRFERAEGR